MSKLIGSEMHPQAVQSMGSSFFDTGQTRYLKILAATNLSTEFRESANIYQREGNKNDN